MKTTHLIEIKLQNEQLCTLKILSNHTDDLHAEICEWDKKTKQQIQNMPIVLEVKNDNLQANELAVLLEILAQNNMSVAGIRASTQELIDFAKLLGLSIFNNPIVMPEPDQTIQTPKNAAYQAPKIVAEVVESGEQVLSKAGDLVLLNAVKTDAEVMSCGSVLAYKNVQGKVFAGIYGDEAATIFIQSFNAQIVSIAGVYKKFDTPPAKLYMRCVMIDLYREKLRFHVL